MQAGRGGGASIYKIRRQNEPFQNGIAGYNYLININFFLLQMPIWHIYQPPQETSTKRPPQKPNQ